MPAQQNIAILVATIGGHQVTVTNLELGTAQVSRAAYARFRELMANDNVVSWRETQSQVICELGACFDSGEPAGRDRYGNLLLRDMGSDLMFVIEDKRRILVAVYSLAVRRRQEIAIRGYASAS